MFRRVLRAKPRLSQTCWPRHRSTQLASKEKPADTVTLKIIVKEIAAPSKDFGLKNVIAQIQGSNKRHRFSGASCLEVGDMLTVFATKQSELSSGRPYFSIKDMIFDKVDKSLPATKALLQGVDGLGPKSVQALLTHFGENIYQSLREKANELREAQNTKNNEKIDQILSIHKEIGITLARFRMAMEVVQASDDRGEMLDSPLPNQLVKSISSQFKKSKSSNQPNWHQFKQNPFQFANDGIVTLSDVDEYFKEQGGSMKAPERIEAYLYDHLNRSIHTWDITYSVAVSIANKADISPTTAMEHITKLAEQNDPNSPFGFTSNRVFLRSTHQQEETCVRFIKDLVDSDLISHSVNSENVRELLNRLDLTAPQRKAIQHAFLHNLTIIFGKSGSGKSTTLKHLHEFLHKFFGETSVVVTLNDIIQKELQQSTGLPVKTLKQFDSKMKVKPKILIVHDAALLGLEQWNSLFVSANSASIEKLILTGDSEQLGPIGKGHVFWNLLTNHRTKFSVVKLDSKTNFKAPESSIISNAYRLSRGESALESNDQFQISFIGSDRKQWPTKALELWGALTPDISTADSVILSMPVHIKALNRICQKSRNENQMEVSTVSTIQDVASHWRVGDSVIWKNKMFDPIEISEGTRGIITGFQNVTNDSIHYFFDAKTDTKYEFVTIRCTDRSEQIVLSARLFLLNVQLAYALTVDDTRLSAFQRVFCLFEEADQQTNRNMLYTAVTRAKEKCVLAVPSKEALDTIVRRTLNFDNVRTMMHEKWRCF